MLRLPLAAVSLLLLGAAALPAAAQDKKKEFRQDWLDKDLAMVKELAAALKEPPRKLDELIKVLGASREDLDRDSGFGGHQLKLVRYGGYTSCWITITAFQDQVADLVVFQDCPEDREQRQRTAILPLWNGMVEAGPYGFTFHLARPEVLARHTKAVEFELGLVPELEVPEEHAEALAMLTSPREVYDYGTVCYYAGIAPAGRAALEELLVVGNVDYFRRALRGLNPEGRVYALEGLLRLQKNGATLTAEDLGAMQLVRSLTVPLSTCRGCFVTEQTAAEALKDLEL